jgi:hypothetical protein
MKPEELAWSRRRTLTPAPELDAHVAVVGTAPGELRLRTQAADPFDLRLHRFYAPHWRAWLDGRPVGVSAHGVRGLVSVAVPGGTHELLLGEQRAPLYTAANAASAAAFAAVLVMLGTAWVHLRPALLGGATAALVAGLLALPALVGRAPSEVHAADLSFEAGLSLVGWSQQPAPHRVGEALAVDLYWLVRREIGTDQDVVLRLLDADGRERAVLRRAPRWGAAPTSTWTRGELVHDQHELTLPEGLPAGTYVLEAGLAEAGGARVERLVAGEIELPAASSRANPALPAGLVPFPVDFEDGISLVGYVPGPGAPPATRRLAPGGMVELTLVWRVREETPHDVATSLFLADARGEKWG